MTNPMHGVFAVPTTPYTEDGDQNLDALSSRIEEVLASGVTGLLGLGATGEALALSAVERESQIKTIVSAVDGRAHVVIGCMAYTPAEMSAQISNAADWGADAVMVTPPFYGGLEPEAVIAALRPVLTASELPVMVYNNPHSTGTDLLPDHVASLQDTGRLWSVKETSGAATRFRELCSRPRRGHRGLSSVPTESRSRASPRAPAAGWQPRHGCCRNTARNCGRRPTAVIGPAPSTSGELWVTRSDSSKATPHSSHSSNRH